MSYSSVSAAQYRTSDKYRLLDWLQGNGLEYYYVSFIQSEVTSLNDVRNLTVDENLFDELEITLPGHKKRLRKAGIVKLLYILFTWPKHDRRTLQCALYPAYYARINV